MNAWSNLDFSDYEDREQLGDYNLLLSLTIYDFEGEDNWFDELSEIRVS